MCRKYQEYVEPPHSEQINEDTLGQIQTTIGKAQLLINQKFKQFRGLCLKNIVSVKQFCILIMSVNQKSKY